MELTVYGTGCMKCRMVEERAKEAVAELGVEAEILHITDLTKMAKDGVLFTPALAIDGVVKAGGRVPSVAEIKGWLGS